MEFKTFEAELGSIYAYFQAKMPPQSAMGLWFADVKYIPSGEPLKFITAAIKNMDALPRNIAKAFKSGWDSWVRVNQDKIQYAKNQTKTKCHDCDNIGLIFCRDKSEKYPYCRVYRCASCRNWAGEVPEDYPAATLAELERRGFEVDNSRMKRPQEKAFGITDIIEGTGQRV